MSDLKPYWVTFPCFKQARDKRFDEVTAHAVIIAESEDEARELLNKEDALLDEAIFKGRKLDGFGITEMKEGAYTIECKAKGCLTWFY